MRVERAHTDQVKQRMDMLKARIQEKKSAPVVSAVDDYDSRLAIQALEAEKAKRQRKEDASAKRIEKEAAELESMDPEIAALMGFGGFGSSKNK